MAYNPKDKPAAIASIPNMPSNGKPGQLISQLQKLEAQAMNELKFAKEKDLKRLPNVNVDLGPKVEFYMEWWNIGDANDAIRVGTCETADLRHLLHLITGPKHRRKRTMIFIRREDTGKVLYDKRSTMGRG